MCNFFVTSDHGKGDSDDDADDDGKSSKKKFKIDAKEKKKEEVEDLTVFENLCLPEKGRIEAEWFEKQMANKNVCIAEDNMGGGYTGNHEVGMPILRGLLRRAAPSLEELLWRAWLAVRRPADLDASSGGEYKDEAQRKQLPGDPFWCFRAALHTLGLGVHVEDSNFDLDLVAVITLYWQLRSPRLCDPTECCYGGAVFTECRKPAKEHKWYCAANPAKGERWGP